MIQERKIRKKINGLALSNASKSRASLGKKKQWINDWKEKREQQQKKKKRMKKKGKLQSFSEKENYASDDLPPSD